MLNAQIIYQFKPQEVVGWVALLADGCCSLILPDLVR